MLVNYGWQWDLDGLKDSRLQSEDISRIDMIVRWGVGRRLRGFLPVQSLYANFYVVDEYWPDYKPKHLTSKNLKIIFPFTIFTVRKKIKANLHLDATPTHQKLYSGEAVKPKIQLANFSLVLSPLF